LDARALYVDSSLEDRGSGYKGGSYDSGGDHNIIEVYVRYLRRKMEAGGESRLIQTIRGIGYILRESA
jgi:DNA-binding response OmpR family regulator